MISEKDALEGRVISWLSALDQPTAYLNEIRDHKDHYQVMISFAVDPVFDFSLIVPRGYAMQSEPKFDVTYDQSTEGRDWVVKMTQFLGGTAKLSVEDVLEKGLELHEPDVPDQDDQGLDDFVDLPDDVQAQPDEAPASKVPRVRSAPAPATGASTSAAGAVAAATNGDNASGDGGRPTPDDEEDKDCPICRDDLENSENGPTRVLEKCGHKFHQNCLEESFKKIDRTCPVCKTRYGMKDGDMPPGRMTHHVVPGHVPGFDCKKMIVIDYSFHNGVQGPEHPQPGARYSGTHRTAYLPDTPEGQKVYRLLKLAFDKRITFTVGTSVTTGRPNTTVWNGIHHKTSLHGGAQGFGYPDPEYLSRVTRELADAGITEDLLTNGNA